MAQPRPVHHATPQLADWLIFAFIIGIGGSSFAMIRGAVETVPPAVVTVGRLWVGAIFLYAVMKHAGRKFPPLIEDTGNGATLHSHWRWMISIGVIGYIAPFFLFPWAQQFVDSGLAGIYMAFMPIWTVVLAFLFAGEPLGPRKIIGFALGLIGVVLLIGPGVVGLAQTHRACAAAGVACGDDVLRCASGYHQERATDPPARLRRRRTVKRRRTFDAGALPDGSKIWRMVVCRDLECPGSRVWSDRTWRDFADYCYPAGRGRLHGGGQLSNAGLGGCSGRRHL